MKLPFFGLLAPLPLAAADLAVTTTSDLIDPNDDVLSLREAVIAANASLEDDTIFLPDGVYTLTLVGADNTAVLGDLDIFPRVTSGSLTIRGTGADAVIDATLVAPNRSFHALAGSIVMLEDLSIRNGIGVSGSGLYVSGSATLNRVRFADNSTEDTPFARTRNTDSHSARDGGAVYISSGGSLIVNQCVFRHNEAGDNGGAIHNNRGLLTVTDSHFDDNEAGDSGGALRTESSSNSSFDSCTFARNESDGWGGAIAANGGVGLTRCLFQENDTTGSGGALSLDTASPITRLVQCQFSGNTADNGGAIRNLNFFAAIECTFEGNRGTTRGGAVSNFGQSGLFLSTFTSNSTNDNGGALYNEGALTAWNCGFLTNTAPTGTGGAVRISGGSNATFTNCGFHDNTANSGAGFFVASGSATLRQCTISGSIPGTSIRITGGSIHLENSVLAPGLGSAGNPGTCISFQNDGNETITAGGINFLSNNITVESLFPAGNPNGAGNFVGTLAAPLDALLAPLGHYGGPSPSRPPLPGSPVIDTGDALALPLDEYDLDTDGDFDEPVPLDRRGLPRVIGAGVDLGSVEAQPLNFALLFPTLDPTGDENGNGHSNYHDYASGFDPSSSAFRPSPSITISAGIVTYSYPFRPAEVLFEEIFTCHEYSTSLQGDSWDELPESAYTLNLSDPAQAQLELAPAFLSGKPRLFMRHKFLSGSE